MAKCISCGHENPLGCLFCTRCRGRLSLETRAEEEGRRIPGFFRLGLKSVLVLIVLVVVGLGGLMLWPAGVESCYASDNDFRSACRKINLLESIPGSGFHVFTENEVNAYMKAVVTRAQNTAPPGPFNSRISSVRLALGRNDITIKVVKTLGPFALGPVMLGSARTSYELTGVPEASEEGFVFRLRSGRLGRLPVPRQLCGPAVSDVTDFFSTAKRERAFLDGIDNVKIAESMVAVSSGRQHHAVMDDGTVSE